MDSVVIIADEGPVSGVTAAAAGLGGKVTAVVVGPRAWADAAAASGATVVRWYHCDGLPENLAASVAQAAITAAPVAMFTGDGPGGRVMMTRAAAALGFPVVNGVRTAAVCDAGVTLERQAAGGKVVETLTVTGPFAAVYDGDPGDPGTADPAPVEEVDVPAAQDVTVVEPTHEGAGAAGLKNADRVVGVGLGVRARDDLALIDDLAGVLGAEIACSLPLVDDMRWYDESHVVGSSTQQIAPRLYIAVGISGQPQHLSGVRAAKRVVAVNSDPDATIFKKCHYGIRGDLYDVLPALTAELRKL